jgi:hypothetical protein
MELGAVAGYSGAEGGGKVPADKFCAAIADKCELIPVSRFLPERRSRRAFSST